MTVGQANRGSADCAGRGVGGILGSSWSQVGYPEHWSPRAPDKSRWVTKWKPALNAFVITFTDRTPRQRTTENENVIYTIGRDSPATVAARASLPPAR